VIEQVTKLLTAAVASQKKLISDISSKFESYQKHTDEKITLLTESEQLRDKFVQEKVDTFLASIPLPKDADNEYILSQLQNDAKKITDTELQKVNIKLKSEILKTQELTKEELEKIQKETKDTLVKAEDSIDNILKAKLKLYTSQNNIEIKKHIQDEVAKIPKAKDGKDAKVDYQLINKQVKKEVSNQRVVKDITYNKTKRQLTVSYTDKTDKKLEIKKEEFIIHQGGGGGVSGGFNISSLKEITSLQNTDYLVVIRDGKSVKISAQNASSYFGSEVVPDGAYVDDNGNYYVDTSGNYIISE
jgi:hypothetical protein